MNLFSGAAFFSPLVPGAVKEHWVSHGGIVTTLEQEEHHAMYVFCDNEWDPWYAKLHERSMAIFHWSWIPAVVKAQFRLPISAYVIDGHDNGAVLDAYTEPNREFNTCSAAENSDRALSHSPHDPYSHAQTVGEVCIDFSSSSIGRFRESGNRFADSNKDDAGDQTLIWHEGKGCDDPLSELLSRSSSGDLISVGDALDALHAVSTGKAAQFVPRTSHLGKEFQCHYTQ